MPNTSSEDTEADSDEDEHPVAYPPVHQTTTSANSDGGCNSDDERDVEHILSFEEIDEVGS